jgi:hypothetical protein
MKRMKWPELVASKWEDFDVLISHMIDQGHLLKEIFFFRGQSDKKWSLLPSFTRILNKIDIGFFLKDYDVEITKKFKSIARQHIPQNMTPDDEDWVGWWQLMQHYKVPTRLLDWTISPYVAAYFAVIENIDNDGAIWAVNYTCLEKAVEKELKKEHCSTTETDMWYLKNPLLQNTSFIRAANTKRKNQRVIAQQAESTFTVNVFFDHALTIESLLRDFESPHQVDSKPIVKQKYFKIIIPKESKMDFLARLHLANISASSLFPGLDGVGLAIKEEMNWQIHVATKSSNRSAGGRGNFD